MDAIKRRDFLRIAGAGTAASLVANQARADGPQAAGKKAEAPGARSPSTLVAVYLRGGQDTLNTIVPYGEKRYYELRPTIAVPPPGSDPEAALKLDGMFGFHPALQALLPWWEKGRLAAIVNVGSPHPTRSHFDAQDFMEYAAPGMRTVTQGWLNRYLALTQEAARRKEKEKGFVLRAVAMQNLLPRALRGACPALAVPDGRILQSEDVLDTFESLYAESGPESPAPKMDARREEDVVLSVGRQTLETLRRYKEAIRRPRPAGGRASGYSGWFGAKLRDIAAVIHADVGLEVACVDFGGWDHHTAEGSTDGVLARMLKELGGNLAAFAEDLGDRLAQTLVLVMTEFGRNTDENGNRGTDHGRGGAMWLLGGNVKGGKVHGDWRGLDPKVLADGRDLPVATDFRDVFAAVLRHHLGCEPPRGFFPDYTPKPVPGLF